MVREALDDLQGYYLLAYAPDASSFDARTGRRLFHKLSVRVKRSGLRVRSREGFYGPGEPARPVKPPTRREQLLAALTSPFNAGDIGRRMTALAYNDAKLGSYVLSMLHIDAKDLTFTRTAAGDFQGVLDSVAITFGDNGQPVEQSDLTLTFKAKPEIMETVRANGITLSRKHPVKKPGGYQMRLAVRDVATGRIGTANQFVDVPDVSKNRLALSGILLQEARETLGKATADPRSGALRQFQPGGWLKLGALTQPGDYVLQVIVTDKLADPKNAIATQWTDFQVAP